MAVADIVPKIAGAAFLQPYIQNNIWMSLVDDVSAELPGYGDTLTLPSDDTPYAAESADDISVDQQTLNNLKWEPPKLADASAVELVINKQFQVNTLINPVQERRVRPSFLVNAARKNSEKLREQANSDIRAEFVAGKPADAALRVSTTAAAWGNEAHQDAVLKAIGDARVKADYAYWPSASRVCVVSPAIQDVVVAGMERKNIHFAEGLNDRLVQMGVFAMYRGWELVVDNSLEEGRGAANDANHPFFYMNRGVGLAYAGELRQMRTFQSEVYVGMMMQGLYTYGVKATETSKLMRGESNIT